MAPRRYFGRRKFSSPFKIKAGDVVEFGYTTKDGKSQTRQAIVISPEFKYPTGVVMGCILLDGLSDIEFLSLVREPVYTRQYKKSFRSFFLDGARALQQIDIKLPDDASVDILVNPDRYLTWEEVEAMAVVRYAWMANRSGGQTTGNKMVVVPVNSDIYYNFVHTGRGNTFANFEEYQQRYKNMHALLVSVQGILPPKFIKTGKINELVPQPEDPRWVKEVETFATREAIIQRHTFHEDIDDE